MTTLLNLSSIRKRLLHRARVAGANTSRQQRLAPAVVSVKNQSYSIRLREKPVVGAIIDVGFPVRVVESKDVAGGGMLVTAEKIDSDVALGATR